MEAREWGMEGRGRHAYKDMDCASGRYPTHPPTCRLFSGIWALPAIRELPRCSARSASQLVTVFCPPKHKALREFQGAIPLQDKPNRHNPNLEPRNDNHKHLKPQHPSTQSPPPPSPAACSPESWPCPSSRNCAGSCCGAHCSATAGPRSTRCKRLRGLGLRGTQ